MKVEIRSRLGCKRRKRQIGPRITRMARMGSGEIPCFASSIRGIRVIRGFFVVEPDLPAAALICFAFVLPIVRFTSWLRWVRSDGDEFL